MTTVANLIEYLQTLKPETDVRVAVAVNDYHLDYTTWGALEIPTLKEDDSYINYSDTIEYCGKDASVLWIGRTR